MSASEESVEEDLSSPAPESEAQPEVNPLNMSDEDFDKLAEPSTAPEDAQEEGVEDPTPEAKEEETPANIEDKATDETDATDATNQPAENAGTAVIPTEQGQPEPPTKTSKEAVGMVPDNAAIKAVPENNDAPADVDYKAEYEKLMAPFKANGTTMQVHNSADVISLMQQGANYNKKMAGLKPVLKVVKMLENNGLLDEKKLTHLIDLDKNNPGAIEKLLKDGNVDPLEIDLEKEAEYKPGTYTVSDKDVELDTVLDDLKDSPSFDTTIDIVGNKWDEASKEVIVANPNIIKTINDHVSSGIYDQIVGVVETERALGRLGGMSDIQAYKTVGDALEANGAFNTQQANEPNNQQPNGSTVLTEPSKKQTDPALKNRKMAASSTKSISSKSGKSADFNPLALSDEEFDKLSLEDYI